MQLTSQRDRVCAISAEATQEAALEGMLRKVQEKWTGVELTVKQYKEAKDAYILGSTEDVQAVLEDSLAVLSTICSSRFVAGRLLSPLQQQLYYKRLSIDRYFCDCTVIGEWRCLQSRFAMAGLLVDPYNKTFR